MEQDPGSFYRENGYYIFRSLVPHELIDRLLASYTSDILPSKSKFMRQSTGSWEANKVTKHGYCEQSFLNIHDFPKHSSFSDDSKDIFCSSEVQKALIELTENPQHQLVQSMFFDLNTATRPHQDWYYLDTIPNGFLLAGWFALEDIREEAGRFFVVPGSHKSDFNLTPDEIASNTKYAERIQKHVEGISEKVVTPPLKKGDVLFWNSGTIHGSTKTTNPQYSRKSLTAHYVPSTYKVGRRYENIELNLKFDTHNNMQFKVMPPDKAEHSMLSEFRTNIFNYAWNRPKLMRAVKKVQSFLK